MIPTHWLQQDLIVIFVFCTSREGTHEDTPCDTLHGPATDWIKCDWHRSTGHAKHRAIYPRNSYLLEYSLVFLGPSPILVTSTHDVHRSGDLDPMDALSSSRALLLLLVVAPAVLANMRAPSFGKMRWYTPTDLQLFPRAPIKWCGCRGQDEKNVFITAFIPGVSVTDDT